MNSVPGSETADSYVSVEYADAFAMSIIDHADWPDTQPEKEAALKEATRVLDEQFSWSGSLTDYSQALAWPRTGFTDPDGRPIASNVIPKRVMDATCNLALYLLQNGGLNQSASDLRSLKAGPISIAYSENEQVSGVPMYIVKSLNGFGSYRGHTLGAVYSVGATRC